LRTRISASPLSHYFQGAENKQATDIRRHGLFCIANAGHGLNKCADHKVARLCFSDKTLSIPANMRWRIMLVHGGR